MAQYLGSTESLQKALRLGTEVDTVYYSSQTLTTQRADVRPYFGRYQQSFTSLSTGQQQGLTFVLPANSLLGGVALSIKLPNNGAGGANYTRYALPRGWGYALIREVRVEIGGGNPIVVSGPLHTLNVLRQADTAHKRDAVYANGGRECLTLDEFQGDNLQCYVHLDLPFSKITALSQKMPFDASLLSAPIRVQVDLNPLSSVICGDGVGGALPLNYEKGFFILSKEYQFVNPSHSLRETLMSNTDAVYNYPFLHQQTFSPYPLPPAKDSYTIPLSGFITGQLLAIVLALEDLTGTDKTRTACRTGAFPLAPMRNIQLSYGGQLLYSAPDGLSSLFELEHDTMPGAFEDSRIQYIDNAAHAAGFTSSPVSSRYTVIQMAQFNEKIFSDRHSLYQYGPNVDTQTLTLSFSPGLALEAASEGFRLWVGAIYNGMILCNSGNAKIEILP